MSALLTGTPLTGRVAVISGASSGIGAATRLARLGAKVAVLARRKEKLDALVASINGGGTAVAVPVDVTGREAVHAAARQVADQLGTADLVVNNAGVQLISPITDLRQDDWQRQIDLNITGVMNVIGAFVPHLTAAAAAGKPADLITTSSIAATRILEKFSVYSGTKAYISHLTRLLRVELGPQNVRVATIEPGMVDTDQNDFLRQNLLPDGRYDEARGDRPSAYTGRYWVNGTRIDYLDDLGFWAYGEFRDGELHHAGYRLTRR
ncbi:SDR family NAD(P)-dependent oxidoreductase [Kibdelosporangium persicum]|uniref:Short-chain alcohol dehydrogenase n=1 Tax=Kibdelosporangium persicum TaxID=2698649 RepID=A0ABX2FFK2_9PSEU|nr:SDR family NAD(P)-dependent oxidoreductase [Kibdelosporangium persicum]NRN70174.1 Short-chain alcohol dehydrogenase [Kibdelosporangium persicum]